MKKNALNEDVIILAVGLITISFGIIRISPLFEILLPIAIIGLLVHFLTKSTSMKTEINHPPKREEIVDKYVYGSLFLCLFGFAICIPSIIALILLLIFIKKNELYNTRIKFYYYLAVVLNTLAVFISISIFILIYFDIV